MYRSSAYRLLGLVVAGLTVTGVTAGCASQVQSTETKASAKPATETAAPTSTAANPEFPNPTATFTQEGLTVTATAVPVPADEISGADELPSNETPALIKLTVKTDDPDQYVTLVPENALATSSGAWSQDKEWDRDFTEFECAPKQANHFRPQSGHSVRMSGGGKTTLCGVFDSDALSAGGGKYELEVGLTLVQAGNPLYWTLPIDPEGTWMVRSS